MRMLLLALAALAATADPGAAQPAAAGWSSLAADRVAARVGDSLTVLIFESAQATNTAQRGTQKVTRLAGEASADSDAHRAEGRLESGFSGEGRTSRSDRMVGSISAVVTEVLPNGDLRLFGEQSLLVHGEHTVIRLSGRARPADITAANTVLSTRLAEANIAYEGAGFGARAARPGLIGRLIDRLGLF